MVPEGYEVSLAIMQGQEERWRELVENSMCYQCRHCIEQDRDEVRKLIEIYKMGHGDLPPFFAQYMEEVRQRCCWCAHNEEFVRGFDNACDGIEFKEARYDLAG